MTQSTKFQLFDFEQIHCLGLLERYDSIQWHSKKNQSIKNHCNDNYSASIRASIRFLYTLVYILIKLSQTYHPFDKFRFLNLIDNERKTYLACFLSRTLSTHLSMVCDTFKCRMRCTNFIVIVRSCIN